MKPNTKFQSFLATSSKKFLHLGFAIAILSAIVAFNIPFKEQNNPYSLLVTEVDEVMEIEEIIFSQEKKYVPKKVPDTKIAEVFDIDTEPFIDELIEKPEDKIIDIEHLDHGDTDMPDEIIDVKPDPILRNIAEVMPQFPGGEKGLLTFLSDIEYCSSAKSMDIEGKVYIEFVINKKGNVTDARVAKGVHPCLDEAALRKVQSMPQWTPAMQGTEKVNLVMVLPVNFVLR